MQYPLISEYVKAIRNSKDNLDSLSNLEPVMDGHNEPLHSSGAFAVVFKMLDKTTGEYHALKCFTEDQKGRNESYSKISQELEISDSSYLINVKYYDNELFVDSICTSDTEFPVLLMDWVEGITMDAYVAMNYQDKDKINWLTYRFCNMAGWLHSQTFAHGDIKPDNIMVRPDESLTLIDYDGMYTPLMKGMESPTLGSKDLSHPLRDKHDFNETIDDFSLASIALSLKAISLDPDLYADYKTADGLLLSKTDYLNLGSSKMMKILCQYMDNIDFCKLYGNFLLAYTQKDLSLHSFRNFLISKP